MTGITTATSIHLSWNSDSEVDGYELMWQTNDLGGCSGGSYVNNTTITDSSISSYVIKGLEENTNYDITLRLSNSPRNSAVNSITALTLKAGENTLLLSLILPSTFSSICFSIFCECVQLY